jgi:hypothetical protein
LQFIQTSLVCTAKLGPTGSEYITSAARQQKYISEEYKDQNQTYLCTSKNEVTNSL